MPNIFIVLGNLPFPMQRAIKRSLSWIGRTLQIVPIGSLLSDDVRRRLPHEDIQIIFDVGANVGQSAKGFVVNYPNATIYSFEPSPDTFSKLKSATQHTKRIRTFNLAFGNRAAVLRFDCNDSASERHHIAKNQLDSTLPCVQVTTIDSFCVEKNIHCIDYLKIDTEGHDLSVLAGAENMLRTNAIGVVVVECSMNPDNDFHVAFSRIYDLMSLNGYRVFGIYEQVEEIHAMLPNIRRANVAFLSPHAIQRNRRTEL
ncbi:MAG TPA: FkbM family methyltransferase [Terracidiphilus sp.]|nr:FkbM family methyltransferase [Terracidiphilus sp.]